MPLPLRLCLTSLLLLSSVGCRSTRADAPAHVLVFASGRSANGDLFVLEGEEAVPRLLAGTDAPEGNPRWDASRSRIIYQRFPRDGEAGPTRLVAHGAGDRPEDGRLLFDDPNGDAPPSWSQDGRWIAYVAERDGRTDVFLADAEGGDERRLTDDDIVDRYPVWGPGSRYLAVARRLPGGWDLFLLDVEAPDAQPVRLTRNERYVGHPSWSADGRFLAFDTVFEEDVEIAMLTLATKEVRRLTTRPGNDLVPTWSPDGMRVVFGGVVGPEGNWEIWEVDVATGELSRLTHDPAFDGSPLYVPASLVAK